MNTVSVPINTLGDNLWDKMKANQPNLGYTEQELIDNRELFVWIMVTNRLDNLRRLPFNTLTVPTRSSLAEVVSTVRGNPATYTQKFFTWVEMDRCVDQP